MQRCLHLADFAVKTLRQRGIDAWRHDDNSITVVFPKPPAAVMQKWIIAPRKSIAHIITLPPMTEAVIEHFADDFANAKANANQETP